MKFVGADVPDGPQAVVFAAFHFGYHNRTVSPYRLAEIFYKANSCCIIPFPLSEKF